MAEKLAGIATEVRETEGRTWAEPHIDFPRALGLARVYPRPVERSKDEKAKIDAPSEEYDALVSEWDAVEELRSEVEARFKEIDAALDAFGDGTAYDAQEIARGGVFVILGQDGVARIERGPLRPENVPTPKPEAEPAEGEARTDGGVTEEASPEAEGPEEESSAPLPERLVLDLTAHRTLALRDALADQCDGGALGGGPRHGLVRLLPDLRPAHCASLTVNAVRAPSDRKPGAWAHADRLAEAVDLDMSGYWSPTVTSNLGRVTKGKIGEAVREAVSDEAAEWIGGLKKPDMASEAEALLAGKGRVPGLLRKLMPVQVDPEVQPEAPSLTEKAA